MVLKSPHKIKFKCSCLTAHIFLGEIKAIQFGWIFKYMILTLSGMTRALMSLQYISAAAGHRFKTGVKQTAHYGYET